MSSIGQNVFSTGLMSVLVYAGSLQYLAVDFIRSDISLLQVAIISLLVNFRHVIYGLSLLEKYKLPRLRRLYSIYSLTDETYAVVSSTDVPEGADKNNYYFYVSLMNHLYWIGGSVLGNLLGTGFGLPTKGIEFALTALFIVLMLEQGKVIASRLPFAIGAVFAILALLLSKPNMLLISVLTAIPALFLLKGRVEAHDEPN